MDKFNERGESRREATDAATRAVACAKSVPVHRARWFASLALALAIIASLFVATYAWFTNNMAVNTNSVSVHSSDAQLVVELGDASTGSWQGSGDVPLRRIGPDEIALSPVSTFDLQGFAENSGTNANGEAASFHEAADGEHFYHGTLDVRASVQGSGAANANGDVALYLSEPLSLGGADAALERASRVGVRISQNGVTVSSHIFELDSSDGGHRAQHPATVPNLVGYSDGMLLGWKNGQLACSANVSESPEGYIMGASASAGRPEHALAMLSPGETYRIDVYYYIEGTDPDSSDYLYKNEGALHVGLFAVLDGGAA